MRLSILKLSVTPAKAGAQKHESTKNFDSIALPSFWVPIFIGMTDVCMYFEIVRHPGESRGLEA